MPSTFDDYEVLQPIGSGSYGSCAKIRRIKDNKLMAWKVVDYLTMTMEEKKMLVSEVNLLRDLKHEHIVRLYDRIIDKTNARLYIIMEWCEGGDLDALIARHKRDGTHIEETFVWQVCHQIASALRECHCRYSKKSESGSTRRVLHRDLKPANVFLDSFHNIKLGDFGMARVLNSDTSFASTFVGTPYYMSPELMNGKQYNEKSDVWAVGCLLYELCALNPPFRALGQAELAQKICSGLYSPVPVEYSSDMKEMIAVLLNVEESLRPSIEEVLVYPLLLSHVPKRETVESESSCGATPHSDSLLQRERALTEKSKALQRYEDELEERRQELKARKAELDKKKAELDKREAELNRQVMDLDIRQKSLQRRSVELELREKDVQRRVVELELREKNLEIRERRAEEMKTRADNLLSEYAAALMELKGGRRRPSLPSSTRTSSLSDSGSIHSNRSSPDRRQASLLRSKNRDSEDDFLSDTDDDSDDDDNIVNVNRKVCISRSRSLPSSPRHPLPLRKILDLYDAKSKGSGAVYRPGSEENQKLNRSARLDDEEQILHVKRLEHMLTLHEKLFLVHRYGEK